MLQVNYCDSTSLLVQFPPWFLGGSGATLLVDNLALQLGNLPRPERTGRLSIEAIRSITSAAGNVDA